MKRSRRHCQSFDFKMPDGEIIRGRGQFVGPITEADRAALIEIVLALRAKGAGRVESVTLTKPEPKMKFHPPHVTPTGHEFSINDHGTRVKIQFAAQNAVEISGDEAIVLRSWLDSAELRTQEQHAKVLADEAANPTQEINSGFKVELGNNKHVHVATIEEAEALKEAVKAKADAALQ
jgi:hypothetical protein